MKNKKIIFIGIIFLFFIILGNNNVNASQEINTIEDMVFILGKENIQTNENQIKLLNDINLKDDLIIKEGKYIIDLNEKTISYTKDDNSAFTILGGNIVIKDETENGEIISNGTTFSVSNGLLKIENCKITSNIYGIALSIYNDGMVQIDDGEFFGTVGISAGNLIINGGKFKYGLFVDGVAEPFYNKVPNVIINDGEFTGNRAGLCIWFQKLANFVKLKGGTFKGIDSESTGIYVGGDKYDLNNLLPEGYKFSNNEQKFEKVENEFVSYTYNASANTVSVEKNTNKNLIKLIFVDYDGNVIATEDVLEGQEISLPQAPEKENYVFVGWDIDLEEINEDTVVIPNFDKIYNLYIDYVYDEYYTGTAVKPSVIIRDEITNDKLSEENYDIICENNVNVGTASVLIHGKGKYKYSSQKSEFEILPTYLYNDYEINYNKEHVYTGSKIEPGVKLIHKNIELRNGIDYEVSYESNINAGYGRITINGIGNYKGTIIESFKIKPKEINEIILSNNNFIYTGNEIRPKVIVKSEGKELIENTDYTINYSNNINVGTGIIRINGIGNYTSSKTIEFNIISKNIKNIDIKMDLSNKQYTGQHIQVAVIIKDNNYTLRENIDYTVEYSNNLNIGKATIKIIGKNGYAGYVIGTFNIIPKKAKINSIKVPIIRTVKLTWQKDSSINGYEIYKSTSKNGNYSLVKTISRNSKDSYIFLAHKKGTFYYKIRTYKTVNGIKFYSDYSEVKEIKVK